MILPNVKLSDVDECTLMRREITRHFPGSQSAGFLSWRNVPGLCGANVELPYRIAPA